MQTKKKTRYITEINNQEENKPDFLSIIQNNELNEKKNNEQVIDNSIDEVNNNDSQLVNNDNEVDNEKDKEKDNEKENSEQEKDKNRINGISLIDLKQLIQKNNFQKPKYDFVYNDVDTIENEINEFFNYQDNPYIQEGKKLFQYSFQKSWIKSTEKEKVDYISYLLETLEIINSDQRSASATILLYISQGIFGECSTKEEQIKWIKYNCKLLWQNEALPYCYQLLKIGSSLLDSIVKSYDQNSKSEELQLSMDQANSEISLYLSLLYMIIEVNNGDENFSKELDKLDPPLPAYLFNLVALLANRKNYPVKKLLLLLWKSMLANYGGIDKLKTLKNKLRKENGLSEINESTQYIKATPEDYYQMYMEISTKYPAIYISNHPDLPPLSSNEYKQFLSRNSKIVNNQCTIPYVDYENPMPRAIQEKIEIYKKNLYISLYSLQIVEEKMNMKKNEMEKEQGYSIIENENNKEILPINYWKYISIVNKNNRKIDEINENIKKRNESTDIEFDVIKSIRKLYRNLLPNMPTNIAMLVRLLYYINIGNNIQNKDQKLMENFEEIQKIIPETEEEEKKVKELFQKYIDQIDLERHKEVVTKAVSVILLLLLKYSKYCHALQSEYISQLLVDNNCSILILKMLSIWFQTTNAPPQTENSNSIFNKTTSENNNIEIKNVNSMSNTMAASWLCERKHIKELNFFDFCREDTNSDEENIKENDKINNTSNIEEEKKNDNIKSTSNEMKENNLNINSEIGTENIDDNEEKTNLIENTENNNSNNKINCVNKFENNNEIDDKNKSENNELEINEKEMNLYPSCWRNFFTSINLLRVLQMITKGKLHRILALVQWKTSAVLKRILRVNHIGIQLYALKLLRSQIPYLGKKWKSSNMRIITSIYLNLRPIIEDNYLSSEIEVDVDDALFQEQQLRSLITNFHKRIFPEILLEQESEKSKPINENDEKMYEDFDSRLNLNDNNIKENSNNKIENVILDENFMKNYEVWLHQEVWQHNHKANDENQLIKQFSGNIDDQTSNIENSNEVFKYESSLFSATTKLNKNMFGDFYDDKNNTGYEWCNLDNEDDIDEDELSENSESGIGWDYPMDSNDNVWSMDIKLENGTINNNNNNNNN